MEVSMLDHVGLRVEDIDGSRAFYRETLAPLGYALVYEGQGWAGFGAEGLPDFWISGGGPTSPAVHVAFRASGRSSVDLFHAAGLAAGGTDNGAPGLRPEYHKDYYGAFILDPDGNNIEAVFHGPG
jgi:catechol 2,3-dioxygenase-like lactoylglutathione lyase family enzyme